MIVRRSSQIVMVVLLAAFVLSLPAGKLAAQEGGSSLPESFTTFAVVMGDVFTGHTESLRIRITRWSTEEERDHLLATLIERPEDQHALRDELQKQEEAGFIRGSGIDADWPSERIRYAEEYRDEETGKRRIFLALARPLGFVELFESWRTVNYTVTLVILDVDEKGEGAGILMMGTKITYDPDFHRFVMEHYSTEPVRLTNVRKAN